MAAGGGENPIQVGISLVPATTEMLFAMGAGDKLAANYPDCKHEFPPEVRDVVYRWLDRWLQ